MSKRRIPGLTKVTGKDGTCVWHIDKRVKDYGRLCESTGTSDEEEAQQYLVLRLEQIRQVLVFGVRPKRTFREAATKYLMDNASRRGIKRDAGSLKDLDPFIGDKWIDCIHNDTFKPYIEARKNPPDPKPGERRRKPLSHGSLNRHLSVARNILKLAAGLWKHEGTNLTWLIQAPIILSLDDAQRRKPYPLSWEEQRLLFSELAPHLERMAQFKANTGPREQELCRLRWAWEVRLPELPKLNGKVRSIFILPGSVTKNGVDRVLILNDVAQSIVEEMRGQDPRYVFTYEDWKHKRARTRLARMHSSGWRAARRRAADRYQAEFGRECPEGFRKVRVHDLRHTFGRRLRAADVKLEDRRDLLGHKSDSVTTDYSAAEIWNLIRAANRIVKSRKTPELTLLRVMPEQLRA